ncbi:AMP-binding protein [Oerskovia enterophila]|uniref:Acyl--CoA ligase YhfT n=1 Tax=Oerskovia enterophila TaxID=43678 RepID=A0ABX2XZ15_9CELL|nr:AMP-binding protein [Oerskovia enterophila]OCI29538.1 putative acyl--CoA ligase YhfT [Oerskovia enterophila]
MPVAHAVIAHARSSAGGRCALRSPERSRTYRALAADVAAGAEFLRATGTVVGDVVAISLPDPVDLLTALLAIDLAGATPLVCDHTWSRAQRAEVLRTIAPAGFVEVPLPRGSAGDALAPLSGPAASSLPDDVAPPEPSVSALAWAGFSSGSTGRPRAVVRTRDSWAGSFPAAARLTGTRSEDTVLVPGPLASSLYCFAAVHTLSTGACVQLATGAAAITTALATSDVVHLVPSALEPILDAIEAGAPSRLRTAVVGGASLPADVRERAARAGVGVVTYYGAVELSFVAIDTDGTGLRPFPGVEVEVRELPGATLGEVWVRSPWVAQGYLARATGPFRREGEWATVGDLAELPTPSHPDTPLVLRGRGDGAILTGGATVVPEDVEVVLRAIPGVEDVVVVGTPHRRLGAVVTAVVQCADRPGLRAHLERVARASLSAAQRPRRWYGVRELPRTPSGKAARGAISEALLSGGPAYEALR